MKYIDDTFYNYIENTKLLKKVSKQLYIRRLNIIQNEFFTKKPSIYWIMNNLDKFKTALLNYGKRTGLSRNTLSGFYVPIISLLLAFRDIQEKQPTLLKEWKQSKDSIIDNEHIMNNEPNEKQKKALITFDEIEKIRNKLPDGSDGKLIISLYTMIPPLRADFDKVRIYDKDPNNDKENYIVLNKKKLILNKYKTDKVYGKKEINLPKELMKQINLSLEKKQRDYLFIQKNGNPYISNSWNIYANRLLKKIINENFSLTMFRHIYISRPDLDLNNKTLKEKQEIADQMGHSIETQSKYYWK